MRNTTFIGLLAVAAIAIAALAGAFSSGTSSRTGLTGLENAADATASASGVHVAMSMTVTGGPARVTASGGGEMDPATREASLALSIDATGTQSLHTSITELLKDGTIYVQAPELTEHLPGSRRWVSIDIEQLQRSLGISTNASFGVDPDQYLDYLRSTGADVQPVGTERLRGETVRVYRGTVNLVQAVEAHAGSAGPQAAQKLSAQLRDATAVPIEAWVDSRNRLRKEALALEGREAGGPRISIVSEYFGFGAVKPVTAPPASEVFDLTSEVLSHLEQD